MSDIAKMEEEIRKDQIRSGELVDTEVYQNKLLTQEQEYLTRELEVLREDTDKLSMSLVDLKVAKNYLEVRRVS